MISLKIILFSTYRLPRDFPDGPSMWNGIRKENRSTSVKGEFFNVYFMERKFSVTSTNPLYPQVSKNYIET